MFRRTRWARSRGAGGAAATALVFVMSSGPGLSQTTVPASSSPGPGDDRVCLTCHGENKTLQAERDGRTISLWVDAARFKDSVHGPLGCIRCHTDLPHKFGKPLVQCRECHQESAKVYDQSVHGQRLSEGAKFAPTCQDCHGVHYI